MDRPAFVRIDIAGAVDGGACDVDHATERFLTDRNGDRCTCVHCRHAARETVRRLHGNAAYVAGAQMLQRFEGIDRVADRDLNRVENVGNFKIIKVDVDHRTGDPLDDSFGAFRHDRILSCDSLKMGFAQRIV